MVRTSEDVGKRGVEGWLRFRRVYIGVAARVAVCTRAYAFVLDDGESGDDNGPQKRSRDVRRLSTADFQDSCIDLSDRRASPTKRWKNLMKSGDLRRRIAMKSGYSKRSRFGERPKGAFAVYPRMTSGRIRS